MQILCMKACKDEDELFSGLSVSSKEMEIQVEINVVQISLSLCSPVFKIREKTVL